MAIPAKFRQQLPEGEVYIISLPEGCLAVFPQSEWQDLVNDNLGKLDPLSQSARKLRRKLTQNAVGGTPDKQGRITLTDKQMEAARISKEVVIVGAINCFEIWDAKRWVEEEASTSEEEQ